MKSIKPIKGYDQYYRAILACVQKNIHISSLILVAQKSSFVLGLSQ